MDQAPPLKRAGNGYQKFLFTKYVAGFFIHARNSGHLQEYFELVAKLYEDRWPDEEHDFSEVTIHNIFKRHLLYRAGLIIYIFRCNWMLRPKQLVQL